MKTIYYGHGTFLMQLDGKQVLIDPFFTGNPISDVDPATIDCDCMLLTHGHGDHISDAVSIAQRTDCRVIANYEIATWLGNQGVKNIHAMNHGGYVKTDWGRLKYVNAVHSSMLPDGSYGGNPGGFILFAEGREIYFAGDTALHMDMKLMGDYNSIDLAILPIGDNFTMGVDDAIIASDFVACDKVLGMHYDTFALLSRLTRQKR